MNNTLEKTTLSLDYIEKTIKKLLPTTNLQQVVLELFFSSISESNRYGSEKWGVTFSPKAIRHIEGNLIVFTIHSNAIWLALDQTLLNQQIESDHDILSKTNSWSWDTDSYPNYIPVPSKNGYYIPSDDHHVVWPVIQKYHFQFIKNVAIKYKKLSEKSQKNHCKEFLNYLHIYLSKNVSETVYSISEDIFPEEFKLNSSQSFREGTVKQVLVNAYERNPEARKQCILYYGINCYICNFNFEETYGEVGKGYIHVHHECPISTIGQEYEIDPILDLKPICPNCHAMIHRKKDSAFSVEEVKNMIEIMKKNKHMGNTI